MSNKLIIQGKAWGEFESCKKSKGDIIINGYRSYGGRHTVRVIDVVVLNENQQIVLEFLKSKVTKYTVNPINAIFILGSLWQYSGCGIEEEERVSHAYDELDCKQQAQVIYQFSEWVQARERVREESQ